MVTPAGVVHSSARRSIQLSLMIVHERFTVQDPISGDLFIPMLNPVRSTLSLSAHASNCGQLSRRSYLNFGRNPRGVQPKSCIAGVGSKIKSFAIRLPMATFALEING